MREPRPTGKRYSIRQLAQVAGVSARTLRHYEEQGLLEPVQAETATARIAHAT